MAGLAAGGTEEKKEGEMMNDPAALTTLERYAEALLRFDNRDRYCLQSRNTRDNAPAPLPARAPLHPTTATGSPGHAAGLTVRAATFDPDPPSFNTRRQSEAAASRGALADGASYDPFDAYTNTPIPLYRDGAEYERDEMQDGRALVAE